MTLDPKKDQRRADEAGDGGSEGQKGKRKKKENRLLPCPYQNIGSYHLQCVSSEKGTRFMH